jgi:hypothetical protein
MLKIEELDEACNNDKVGQATKSRALRRHYYYA